MDAEPQDPPRLALPTGRLLGREVFVQTVRDALACAAREGWKEITLSDATFEDWPLYERAVAESLQAWAKTGRRMRLLATRFDAVQRQHARFVRWRQTWDHIIECRVCRSADPLDFPSAIWSPSWVMHRIDPVNSVLVCGNEAQRRLLLREVLQEWERNSSPGFPASTLGL
jgi:hypothetical protein